jgi:hypothetical protein
MVSMTIRHVLASAVLMPALAVPLGVALGQPPISEPPHATVVAGDPCDGGQMPMRLHRNGDGPPIIIGHGLV